MNSHERPKFRRPSSPSQPSASAGAVEATVVIDRAELALSDMNDQLDRIEALRVDHDAQIGADDVNIVAPLFERWVKSYQEQRPPPLARAPIDGALLGASLAGAVGIWHATKPTAEPSDILRLLFFSLAGGGAVGALGGRALQSLAVQRPRTVPEEIPDSVLQRVSREDLCRDDADEIVGWRLHGLKGSWASRARTYNAANAGATTAGDLLDRALTLRRIVR